MKHYFIYTTFGLLCFLQLSCANKLIATNSTIDTVYSIEPMFKDIDRAKLPRSFTITGGYTKKIDTVMQGYHISYLLANYGDFNFVEYYNDIPDFNQEREVVVNIDNSEIDMHVNKRLRKSDFIEYLPKEKITKRVLQSFWIESVNSKVVVLYISFCVIDSDDCYSFELHFNNKGEMKIIPIDEGPMGED